MRRFLLAAAIALAVPSAARVQSDDGKTIAQFYSYRLTDRARFESGYRAHLGWHARRQDRLVWYAWTVRSGPRQGQFIDATAGASLADLDARPDLAGDGADFARTAAPYAEPIDVETWELWPEPSTATPLEDREPSRVVDVFLIRVNPGEEQAFERAIGNMAARHCGAALRVSWYRKLRGGQVPAYMVLLARDRWADLGRAGGTLSSLLAGAYRAQPAEIQPALGLVASIITESWSYEPRLSLIPGTPLTP
ncbi:hypothetical protein [Sphingomonas sp. DT-204]|uniref:hypothetical protein n=1 Tax=Sphingomonas sp. DT-204 TaxID=3396166 RepID=UPI003F1C9D97